jgi:hypothetical protein
MGCDWRGCPHTVRFDPRAPWPSGWVEFLISLQTSGALDERWQLTEGRHQRTITVCPRHAAGVMFGGLGDAPPPARAPLVLEAELEPLTWGPEEDT